MVMMMSEIYTAAAQPFWAAELEYRRERAERSFGKSKGGRRRWVPRRPGLRLPTPRRRPVAVA